MKDLPWESIVVSACLATASAGAWTWQEAVRRHQPTPILTETWEHAHQQFPMPPEEIVSIDVPRESLAEVVKANPFSPQRRVVSPPTTSGGASAGAGAAAPAPILVFKGRVVLGTTQRAIVEDLTTKKTYFLQVGQEVAGYKVLDISESEVLVSQRQTEEKVTLRLTPKP